MAEVTGFTAERMLEIELGTVVSGAVETDGHLHLETRGGEDIDAGNVIGMKTVFHGTDANVPRPDGVPVVYWIGTATPANARAWDHHLRENITP